METEREYYVNKSTIKIIFGNILNSTADVIVSSDDCYISMGGGVSKAICDAEGTNAIRLDVRKKIPAEIGDVVVSTAGNLPQKNIFHVITINKKDIQQQDIPDSLSREDIHKYIIGHSIDKCFALLHAMDLKAIAFPAIGAGVAGIPFDEVARGMSEAITRNLRKTNKPISVEVYLLDRFEKMQKWDFLPMFEQFSAQMEVSRMLNEKSYDGLVQDLQELDNENAANPDIEKDIFISYSRHDADDVMIIYDFLEKNGFKCWLDKDGMYSGISYKKVIVDAIRRAKIMLFVSSQNSNKSRNVVSEVSIAMEYSKKVIPVRIDMTPYSESIQYDLINHDYVKFDTGNLSGALKEMLKKIVSTFKMSEPDKNSAK